MIFGVYFWLQVNWHFSSFIVSRTKTFVKFRLNHKIVSLTNTSHQCGKVFVNLCCGDIQVLEDRLCVRSFADLKTLVEKTNLSQRESGFSKTIITWCTDLTKGRNLFWIVGGVNEKIIAFSFSMDQIPDWVKRYPSHSIYVLPESHFARYHDCQEWFL